MNTGQIIIKLACLAGYLLFAGFSAYFTASSLSLNLLQGNNVWFVFVLVLVVSALAGWCLTNVIAEMKKHVGASRSSFLLNLLGFLIFWTFSFVTNVHYFFVEKHGYNILVKELTSAKSYIIDNTTKSDKAIDEQNERARREMTEQVYAKMSEYKRELNNTMEYHEGFGVACINILNSTEEVLRKDAQTYNDNNEYVIFDDDRDIGDKGIIQRDKFNYLQSKYTKRMEDALNVKCGVIDSYFKRKKSENTELKDLMAKCIFFEENHLPKVQKDGSIDAYYAYNEVQDGEIISKMPSDYHAKCVVREGKEIKSFKVYPSTRMCDTMSVWGDILSGRLVDMTMIQWIIIALIFDLVSFILFCIFRTY